MNIKQSEYFIAPYGFENWGVGLADDIYQMQDYAEFPLYAPIVVDYVRPPKSPNDIPEYISFKQYEAWTFSIIGESPRHGGCVNKYGGNLTRDDLLELLGFVIGKNFITASELGYTIPQDFEKCSGESHKKGYIYLIEAVGTGRYKIGRTASVHKRFNNFGITLPFEIKLIHSFKVIDMSCAESGIHKTFADKRVAGEWFVLSPEDVGSICKFKDCDSE